MLGFNPWVKKKGTCGTVGAPKRHKSSKRKTLLKNTSWPHQWQQLFLHHLSLQPWLQLPRCGRCHLPSMTLDALWLSSGAMGLLASNVQRRGGLGQVGGSSNEVCPSPTSELEELPLKSDSPSELGRKGQERKREGQFRRHRECRCSFPLLCRRLQRNRFCSPSWHLDFAFFLLLLLQPCSLLWMKHSWHIHAPVTSLLPRFRPTIAVLSKEFTCCKQRWLQYISEPLAQHSKCKEWPEVNIIRSMPHKHPEWHMRCDLASGQENDLCSQLLVLFFFFFSNKRTSLISQSQIVGNVRFQAFWCGHIPTTINKCATMQFSLFLMKTMLLS